MDKQHSVRTSTNVKIIVGLVLLVLLFGFALTNLFSGRYEISYGDYLGWGYALFMILALFGYLQQGDKLRKKNLKDFHYLTVLILFIFGVAALYLGVLGIAFTQGTFELYDALFLGAFSLYLSYFFARGKDNLGKDGLLLLYRTSWGMKMIDRIGHKYPKTLRFLSYVAVGMGYLLMLGAFYVIWVIVEIYLFQPDIVRAIKVPPITPLLPYLPEVFELSFLPPFFFTYWILVLIIAAVPHELFHGIFMKRYDIKIKSTGFGFFPWFLPVFLAAFVEQDEESMVKAKPFEQMAVLAAGTFANVLTVIVFFFVMWGFFTVAFTPAGVTFDDYAYSQVRLADITTINGEAVSNLDLEGFAAQIESGSFNDIEAGGRSYVGLKSFANSEEYVWLYDAAPAITQEINGAVLAIEGEPILSIEDLSATLDQYNSGDVVTITTIDENGNNVDREVTLGAHPENSDDAWLGIAFAQQQTNGKLAGKIYELTTSFKQPHVYYAPVWSNFSLFIWNLLIWIILACVSVAVLNMLPVGIFDGGRFFYLTLLVLTGNEKFAERSFTFMTYFFLFLVALVMVFWAYAFFF